MKNSHWILMALFCSCAPRVMELPTGKLVTEAKFNRIVERGERNRDRWHSLSEKAKQRELERMKAQSARATSKYLKSLSTEERQDLQGMEVQVVYDSAGGN